MHEWHGLDTLVSQETWLFEKEQAKDVPLRHNQLLLGLRVCVSCVVPFCSCQEVRKNHMTMGMELK